MRMDNEQAAFAALVAGSCIAGAILVYVVSVFVGLMCQAGYC